mgnify:CR=1 FL=1
MKVDFLSWIFILIIAVGAIYVTWAWSSVALKIFEDQYVRLGLLAIAGIAIWHYFKAKEKDEDIIPFLTAIDKWVTNTPDGIKSGITMDSLSMAVNIRELWLTQSGKWVAICTPNLMVNDQRAVTIILNAKQKNVHKYSTNLYGYFERPLTYEEIKEYFEEIKPVDVSSELGKVVMERTKKELETLREEA